MAEKKKNMNLTVFITCFSISLAIWLSTSFSKDYKVKYSHGLNIKNIPLDQQLTNDSITLNTTFEIKGWDLLFYKTKKKEIEIDLKMYPVQKQLSFSNTKTIIQENFKNFNVLEVDPSSFILNFEELFQKKVPINLNFKSDFAENFYISKKTNLFPDSIIIAGNKETLEKIDHIESDLISISEKDTLVEKIKLIKPSNTRISERYTSAKFDIEEFAEKQFVLKINIDNKPNEHDIIIYPQEVVLKCMLPFSKYEKVLASDFYLSADFNNIDVLNENNLNISIVEIPKEAQNISLETNNIEFIIYQ